MPLIEFSKMHGLGNDFIVIDAVRQNIQLSSAQIKALSDRHFGIGCDQLLLVEAAQSEQADFFYRIYNCDGQQAQQCGNGARCLGRFIHDKGLSAHERIVVETLDRQFTTIQRQTTNDYSAKLSTPNFNPSALPLFAEAYAPKYPFELEGQTVYASAVSVGNPHVVLWGEAFSDDQVATLGSALTTHKKLPQGANIGFVQPISRTQINLRVYERGAGETQACGSGACAAVAVGIDHGLLARSVEVTLTAGVVTVNWPTFDAPIELLGPTALVCDGVCDVDVIQANAL